MFDVCESTFSLQDFERIAAPQCADNAPARARYARFLRSAVRHLPPKQRQVVALYFFGGRNIPAIALELGVHPSTVSRRLPPPPPTPPRPAAAGGGAGG
uniref:sigma-70 region 4 domain-containing protein n=1 Tax=uncultured Anaerotruncus sp. TaxID=905011 RepID=UPI00258BE34A